MEARAISKIPKVRFREPERNLPGRKLRVPTAEARFTLQFARAYLARHIDIHHGTNKREIACARQVAVNGFGIADLLTVAWQHLDPQRSNKNVAEFLQTAKPTVRAFEVKLDNWRKGMIQAHRYRYFANVAILVLPAAKCTSAMAYLDTFRHIRVGLWGFDPLSGQIITHFTPRPCTPIEPRYQHRAIELVATASRALPFP